MTKYAALTRYLRQQEGSRVTLSFQELEKILGFSLPASAWKYASWWANSAGGQSQVKGWREAGWETREVDLRGRRVTFVRVAGEPVAPVSATPAAERPATAAKPSPTAPRAPTKPRPSSERPKTSKKAEALVPASAIDAARLPPGARRLLEATGQPAAEAAAAILSEALAAERQRLIAALAEMRARTNRPGAFDLLAVMKRK